MLSILGAIGGVVAGLASIIAAAAALYGVHLQLRRPERRDPIVTRPSVGPDFADPSQLSVIFEIRNTDPCPLELVSLSFVGQQSWEIGIDEDGETTWAPGTLSWEKSIDTGANLCHFRLRSTASVAEASRRSAINISMVLTFRWNDQDMKTRSIPITITAPSQATIASN